MLIAIAAVAALWSYRDSLARADWELARAALERDDPEAAREHANRCLTRWDGRDDVRLFAARAARLSGHLDEAEAHLVACERQARGSNAVRRERALLQVWQGDFVEFMERVAPRGAADPTLTAEELEALAHGYNELSDDIAALMCLERLTASAPNAWRGHLLAGEIQLRTSRAEEAVLNLERAVAAAPHFETPRRRLAEALIELGRVREAARHLEPLVQKFPDSAEVQLLRGRVLNYRGQTTEARAALERALVLAPNHVTALIESGRLELRAGDPKAARERFRAALAHEPNNPEAWDGLALAQAALGEDAAAAKTERARVLRESGEATRMFNELSNRTDRRPDTVVMLALADRCERLNLRDKATALRLQAVLLNPTAPEPRRTIADYYERTGRSHLAARQRTQMVP